MEFWSTIAGLLRRKLVIIPVLLAGLILGAVAYVGTPVVYVSDTTMVLTTTEYGGTESQDPASPTALTNPMLNFNDSLRTTSAILIQAMSTPGVADQLNARGTTQLFVNDGRTNPDLLGLNGPFLYIVAQSTSPSEAKRVVVEAQKLMREKLTEWQNDLNAPQKTFVSIADVVPPSAAKPDHARATKLGLLAFIFGFLLGLGIAYFGHQLRARRRLRAAVVPNDGDTTTPPDEDLEETLPPPSRAPVLVPREDEEDVRTPVMPTPLKKAVPAFVPAPAKKEADPALVPMSVEKRAGLAVAPAPVKLKVRYRNR